jgi:hypothetical protein
MQPRKSVAPNVQRVSRWNCHTLREVVSIGDRLSHWQMGGDGERYVEPPCEVLSNSWNLPAIRHSATQESSPI